MNPPASSSCLEDAESVFVDRSASRELKAASDSPVMIGLTSASKEDTSRCASLRHDITLYTMLNCAVTVQGCIFC